MELQFGGKAVALWCSHAHLWLPQCTLHRLFYFLTTPAWMLSRWRMSLGPWSTHFTSSMFDLPSSVLHSKLLNIANYPVLLSLQPLHYSFVKMFVYSFIHFFACCFKMEFHYTAQVLCSPAWLWTHNIPASAWVLWLHICVPTPSYFIILSPCIVHLCFSICLASMKKFP